MPRLLRAALAQSSLLPAAGAASMVGGALSQPEVASVAAALDEGLAVRYSTKTSCGGFVPLYRNPITRTFGTMASVERRIFFVPTDELKFMLMLQGRSGAV